MFGYIRPEKADLTFREFAHYRSIYCAICEGLKAEAGTMQRFAVNYDSSFLAIYLLSFQKENPELKEVSCPLRPFRKNMVINKNPILDYTVQLTCALIYEKALDDLRDGDHLRGLVLQNAFRKSAAAFRSQNRERVDEAKRAIDELCRAENNFLRQEDHPASDAVAIQAQEAAGYNVKALLPLLEGGLVLCDHPAFKDAGMRHLAVLAFSKIAAWVYLIDALEDLPRDRKKQKPNPFSSLPDEEAKKLADELLQKQELDLDRHFALLPYVRDAHLIQNIICQGLPAERQRVLTGGKQRPI